MTAPTLLLGDCFEVLQTLDAESIDSCVVDPPYGLNFMGRHWDRGVPATDIWEQVFRVLKPGAHLLSFFGTRTYHRGVVAIEDAGFEIRDQIGWLYGSGFPKSLDVSKAIDKAAGAEREVVGSKAGLPGYRTGDTGERGIDYGDGLSNGSAKCAITAPATDAAKQWDGWGTALKPAWEPIVVARKPLDGTVANNVLTHGVGGINVDGCRVGTTVETWPSSRSYAPGQIQPGGKGETMKTGPVPPGRFPANIIHDGSDEVLAEFAKYGERASGGIAPRVVTSPTRDGSSFPSGARTTDISVAPSTGTAARFFYSSKAGRDDRWSLLTCDCETVKPETWVSRDQNQSDQTDVTSQPRATSEGDSMDECSYSMFTNGSEPTDQSHRGTASTTGTETSSTTGSETSSYAPSQNTNESTPVANSEAVSGGSRADDAGNSSPSMNPSGTCQKRAGPSTGVAASATYARSLRTKNCAVCGAARIEGHPTQKPTSLMRYLVRLVTPKGGTVLDPFAGSGTTLIAAYREDCKAVGIELDPDYFKMAQHRIERATAQMRLDL